MKKVILKITLFAFFLVALYFLTDILLNQFEESFYKRIFVILLSATLSYFISTYIYGKIYIKFEESVFSKIYENDIWTNGSGPGSTIDVTVEYRKILQKIFKDKRFKTYVDIGCGDWQFMKLVNIPYDKEYKGYDIVQSVIDVNKELYEKDNIKFYHNIDLNKIAGGDLLIIKDVMIHWPNKRVQDFLDNILPRFKYALITNTSLGEKEVNEDIYNPGDFRPIDVTKNPFNLENAELLLEYKGDNKRSKRIYFFTNPHL